MSQAPSQATGYEMNFQKKVRWLLHTGTCTIFLFFLFLNVGGCLTEVIPNTGLTVPVNVWQLIVQMLAVRHSSRSDHVN